MEKFRLKQDRFEHKVGTIVVPYEGYDYGCSSDDRRTTGLEHRAMSLDGGTPFFTVPERDLERVD